MWLRDIQLYVFCNTYHQENMRQNKSGAFEICFNNEEGTQAQSSGQRDALGDGISHTRHTAIVKTDTNWTQRPRDSWSCSRPGPQTRRRQKMSPAPVLQRRVRYRTLRGDSSVHTLHRRKDRRRRSNYSTTSPWRNQHCFVCSTSDGQDFRLAALFARRANWCSL